MTRSVPEWIGKTPDTPVPPRVRMRVFIRFGGACQLCFRKITVAEKWICDHIIALINGGENRENNLHPICGWCDRNIKTPADVAEKSRTARQRAKHLGVKKPRSIRSWRRFDGTPVHAGRER